jgi:hypothetical protein
MKKQLNKRTKKTQRGGAASAARVSRPSGPSNGDGYTQADVDEFSKAILTPMDAGYYGASSIKLPPKYFDRNSKVRHGMLILPKWHKMVNESLNSRKQTPLYVALRFGATREMIDMLLDVITDVNRPNGDGSTPLIGLCFGDRDDAKVNFRNIANMIITIVGRGGIEALQIPNSHQETPFDVLKSKAVNDRLIIE